MIRCNCGKTFEDSCQHTAHKIDELMKVYELGHYTVCTECGEEFTEYNEDYMTVTRNASGYPDSAVCNRCMVIVKCINHLKRRRFKPC